MPMVEKVTIPDFSDVFRDINQKTGRKRKVRKYTKEQEKKKNDMKSARKRMKRLQQTPKIKQHIQLFDSSPDKERKGSTVVNVNASTMKNLMECVESVLHQHNIKLTNYQYVNFLDVGSGTGRALACMRNYTKMKCVGVENNFRTWRGSVLYFHQVMESNKKKKKRPEIPFIPLNHDLMELKSFCGAYIVYAWLQGALPEVAQKLLNIFELDDQAMFLATSFSFANKKLEENNIKRATKSMCARFSGTTMSMNVYYKSEIKAPNEVQNYKVGKKINEEEKSIREAFKAYNKYQKLSPDEKTIDIIEKMTKVPKTFTWEKKEIE